MVVASTGVLDELRALGTEQNRKTYRRHGITAEIYGVSYANLNALKQRIKVDHDLARALWASGVHDARILATMVADPKRADAALLDDWARDLGDHVEADALSGFVARTGLARAKAEEWIESDDEWRGTAGWSLLGQLALHDRSLPDDYFAPYLARIERDLRGSKNRVRYAMNNVLIAIGMRGGDLERRAMAAAARIGPVEVDHGQTNCKTPDAAISIQKARARKKRSAPRVGTNPACSA